MKQFVLPQIRLQHIRSSRPFILKMSRILHGTLDDISIDSPTVGTQKKHRRKIVNTCSSQFLIIVEVLLFLLQMRVELRYNYDIICIDFTMYAERISYMYISVTGLVISNQLISKPIITYKGIPTKVAYLLQSLYRCTVQGYAN